MIYFTRDQMIDALCMYGATERMTTEELRALWNRVAGEYVRKRLDELIEA